MGRDGVVSEIEGQRKLRECYLYRFETGWDVTPVGEGEVYAVVVGGKRREVEVEEGALHAGAGLELVIPDDPLCLRVDAAGQPTTDPNAILNGGAQLAFGGYKGAAIALMIEPNAKLRPDESDSPPPPRPTEVVVTPEPVYVPVVVDADAPAPAAHAPDEDHWRLGARAGPILGFGVLPGVGVGLVTTATVAPLWFVAVEGSIVAFAERYQEVAAASPCTSSASSGMSSSSPRYWLISPCTWISAPTSGLGPLRIPS